MPRKELTAKTGQFKKVQGLYRAANRRKYAQAVVEGPQAVRELLITKPQLLRDVYSTERALAAHTDIATLIAENDFYLHLLPPDLFQQLSQEAQGILAVAQIPDEPEIGKLLADAQLLIFPLRAADPGNLGTIIRAADAFGAAGVITGTGSVEVTNPKVIRSSAGSVFHLPIIESELPEEFIAQAKSAGFQVLAADGNADFYLDELLFTKDIGNDVGKFDLTRKTLWVVGNEAHGFSESERAIVDAAVAVRMQGRAESLNVAMATAICLYTSAQAQLLRQSTHSSVPSTV